MRIFNIDTEKLRGLSDKGIGLTKEFWGTVLDNDRWVEEGEAQQAHGSEKLKSLRKKLEAKKHEAKAETQEQRQKVAQKAKERQSA